MKKLACLIAFRAIVAGVSAQSGFDKKKLNCFTLHVYTTANPLGDMCYVIEGDKKLVILEPPAFKDNMADFGDYVSKLNKPVEKVITNYHAAGFSAYAPELFVMVEDMPEFVKGDVYSGMMANFAAGFGDAMDQSDFIPKEVVKKNTTQKWGDVAFKFVPGVASDFPAASILIGDQVYYMHFTPVTGQHISPLQISGRNALDALIAASEQALQTNARLFIGGHGITVADRNTLESQLAYLKDMKQVCEQTGTGDEFILTMQMNYPEYAETKNLTAVAGKLYQ